MTTTAHPWELITRTLFERCDFKIVYHCHLLKVDALMWSHISNQVVSHLSKNPVEVHLPTSNFVPKKSSYPREL
jgi:hypothetical protein